LPTAVWVIAGVLALYAAGVLVLYALGRRTAARALAGFVPDCLVLFKRLLGDPRVPRRRKLVLGLIVVYLASPIDLIPDFLPGLGQLDDAIIVALGLRYLLHGAEGPLLEDHWPGPENSLRVVMRLAGQARD
jgi:uncharacterized membrane protein YkvA (DUF1232 family)